uniref:Cystatin domain-containing protein n=1 Tax=Romanomermis culicivorax TaxID=13658 RepID=A0A915IK60_ROMCU
MIIYYCLLLIVVQLLPKSLNLLISDGSPSDLPTLPIGRTNLAGVSIGILQKSYNGCHTSRMEDMICYEDNDEIDESHVDAAKSITRENKLSLRILLIFNLSYVNGTEGGRNGVNLTDPEQRVGFERLAVYAVELIEYQQRDQNLPNFSVVRIKSAATQVVAGAAYDIIFYAGEKMCANEQVAVDYMVQNADASSLVKLLQLCSCLCSHVT